jgi:hypothetical protein
MTDTPIPVSGPPDPTPSVSLSPAAPRARKTRYTSAQSIPGSILVPPSTGDAERFGTVIGNDGTWAIVMPFNDKMRERALRRGAIPNG